MLSAEERQELGSSTFIHTHERKCKSLSFLIIAPNLGLSHDNRMCIFDDLYSAENAMEQLATGLNKAAETMQTVEPGEAGVPVNYIS